MTNIESLQSNDPYVELQDTIDEIMMLRKQLQHAMNVKKTLTTDSHKISKIACKITKFCENTRRPGPSQVPLTGDRRSGSREK